VGLSSRELSHTPRRRSPRHRVPPPHTPAGAPTPSQPSPGDVPTDSDTPASDPNIDYVVVVWQITGMRGTHAWGLVVLSSLLLAVPSASSAAADPAAFPAQQDDRSHTGGGSASTPAVESVRVQAYGVHLSASHQMLLMRSSCPSEFPWLQNNDHASGRRVPHGVDVAVSPGWGGATFWVEVTITGPLSTDGSGRVTGWLDGAGLVRNWSPVTQWVEIWLISTNDPNHAHQPVTV
jgi:hypothetical protein